MSWKTWTLVFSLFAASVAAQQEPEARPTREEFEGMMDAYVISKLQESLDLSDEQFGKMVVAQKKLQDARREFRRERGEIIRELRRELERDQGSDDSIEKLLERLEEGRRAFDKEEQKRYEDIDSILTLRQRARYRVLEAELQRRLQELVRQVRERNQGRERR